MTLLFLNFSSHQYLPIELESYDLHEASCNLGVQGLEVHTSATKDRSSLVQVLHRVRCSCPVLKSSYEWPRFKFEFIQSFLFRVAPPSRYLMSERFACRGLRELVFLRGDASVCTGLLQLENAEVGFLVPPMNKEQQGCRHFVVEIGALVLGKVFLSFLVSVHCCFSPAGEFQNGWA